MKVKSETLPKWINHIYSHTTYAFSPKISPRKLGCVLSREADFRTGVDLWKCCNDYFSPFSSVSIQQGWSPALILSQPLPNTQQVLAEWSAAPSSAVALTGLKLELLPEAVLLEVCGMWKNIVNNFSVPVTCNNKSNPVSCWKNTWSDLALLRYFHPALRQVVA